VRRVEGIARPAGDPRSENAMSIHDHPGPAPSPPGSRLRKLARLLGAAAVTALLFLVGAGSAAAEPSSHELTEEWGTATVAAEPYFIGGARASATITDTKSDSRCVYVEFKVNAPNWYDGFDKLTRVCGNGDSDSGAKEWVGPSWTSAESVELRICREQGLGRDPCGPVVTIAL
jgi:hypothetical protein